MIDPILSAVVGFVLGTISGVLLRHYSEYLRDRLTRTRELDAQKRTSLTKRHEALVEAQGQFAVAVRAVLAGQEAPVVLPLLFKATDSNSFAQQAQDNFRRYRSAGRTRDQTEYHMEMQAIIQTLDDLAKRCKRASETGDPDWVLPRVEDVLAAHRVNLREAYAPLFAQISKLEGQLVSSGDGDSV